MYVGIVLPKVPAHKIFCVLLKRLHTNIEILLFMRPEKDKIDHFEEEKLT